MSTYAGNAALSAAVKDRVLSTFQQAVALFKQGRTDEVVQGCGLILRMDPMFDPAKKLLEKARNPSAAVDVDALLAGAAPANDPLREAREAMGGRDFQRVVDITTEVLTNDLLNDDARLLNEQAREKLEAAPFVDQFIRKAEQHAQSGNPAAARAELERARSLDGDHPGLRRLEQGLTIQSPAPAAQAAPASFSFDAPAAPAFSFDAPPSFVVDNAAAPPATPGRGTAQATDFGFTFEEEKPAAAAPASFSFDAQPAAPPPAEVPSFSFDAPSTPTAAPEAASFSFDAPPPAAGFGFEAPAPAAFDFSSSPAADTDDQKKIQQYLGDGDRAYDSGDYQTAIDLWSRIFLIDVTNEEASQRIERAKLKRRDFDSKVDAIVSEGVQAWERKDNETARAKFSEALRIDPNNSTAQDYLERLSDSVTEGGAAGYEAPFVPPPASTHDLVEDDDLGMSGSYEAPAAPSIATKKPATKKAPAPVAKPSSSPMKLVVPLLILVALAGGGYFAYSKFFAKPAYDPAATQGIFHQAEALAKRGKYDQAIAMLQDVKADDPQHDKALQMISDLQLKKTQASEMIDGRPAAVVYQESLSSGKASFEAHDYDAAKKFFDTAARVKALPPDMQALYDQAAQKVAKLDAAKGLFREQKYSDAVVALQALQQEDPQNASIRRMLNDAHFNLGAAALQEEKTADAMREFDEVLKSDASDDLAKRSRTLAERYNGQPKDLLYKIYVKYLPLRQQG
jgi:tetratricopeptide (TPR) repeat protein